MISVSGIRGIVGSALTTSLTHDYARAFGKYLGGGTVVVGRDTRTTGQMLMHAAIAGLTASGCNVVTLDTCTTPTCGLMVRRHGAAGGMMITASHNPAPWNGLKFFGSDGIFLDAESVPKFLEVFDKGDLPMVDYRGAGSVTADPSALEQHIEEVLGIVDVDGIRTRSLKVVIDPCNGTGCVVSPKFLEDLGCTVTVLNGDPSGRFAHSPEPTRDNLVELAAAVTDAGADVGFAQDPDADRRAIVDENGSYIGEEYSLALAAAHLMSIKPGPMVANLSTSRMVDDIAERYGQVVHRTPVGEVHVSRKMTAIGAVAGGEGNGGVMDPRVHPARDSLVGMALVLEAMAHSGKTVSQRVADIPSYDMVKVKLDCPREKALEVIERVKQTLTDGQANTEDGLRLDWDRRWVHVRPSNTEPVMRIIAEAETEQACQDMIDRVREIADEVIGA